MLGICEGGTFSRCYAALRRDKAWTQVSGALCGDDKARCMQSLRESRAKLGKDGGGSGFGGHFRAVQGFRYLGEDVACV